MCARACACARCPKSFICWAGRWPVRRRLQCGAIRRSREPTPRLTIKISYIMMCCINKIDHVASYILIHHTSITALARSREEHYISYYDISYIIYHISLYHISICVSALLLAHGRISRLSIWTNHMLMSVLSFRYIVYWCTCFAIDMLYTTL